MKFTEDNLLAKRKETLHDIAKRERWWDEGVIKGNAIPGSKYTLGSLYQELGLITLLQGDIDGGTSHLTTAARHFLESAEATNTYRKELSIAEIQNGIVMYVRSANSALCARDWEFANTVAEAIESMPELSHYTGSELGTRDVAYRYYNTALRGALISERSPDPQIVERFRDAVDRLNTPYTSALLAVYSGLIQGEPSVTSSGLDELLQRHDDRVNPDEEYLEDYFDTNALAFYAIATKRGQKLSVQSEYLPPELTELSS